MKNLLILFLMLLQAFKFSRSSNFFIGKKGMKQAIFDRFDGTCGNPDVIIIFTYSGMRNEGSKIIMNSTIRVKHDVYGTQITLINIERCRNRENLDTCEDFYDHKVNNFCEMISEQNALWTPLFTNFEPQYKCPVKKGIYRAINSEFDISALLLFPLDSWYWRVKVNVLEKETNKLLTCIIVEAHTGTTT